MANPSIGPSGDAIIKIVAKLLANGANLQGIELQSGTEGGTASAIGVVGAPLVTTAGAEQLSLHNGAIVAASSTVADLIAANTAARERIVINQDPTNTIYVGTTGVTTSTGVPIGPLQRIVFTCNNLLRVVCLATQTASVYVTETVAV